MTNRRKAEVRLYTKGDYRRVLLIATAILTIGLAKCVAQPSQDIVGTWVISKVAAEGNVTQLDQHQVDSFIGRTIIVAKSAVSFRRVVYPISAITIDDHDQHPLFQSDIASGHIYVMDRKVLRPDVPLLPIIFRSTGNASQRQWFFDELLYADKGTLLMAKGGVYFLIKREN